jgi:Fe-S-cluster containining protein
MEPGDPAASLPATVRTDFAVPVKDVFLRASAILPAGRTTLTELLPIIQNIESAIIGRVAEEAREAGSPISCKAGCAACCRQMVPLSLFEAEALAKWIHGLPEEQQAELEKRFHGALSSLREAGLIDRILDPAWRLEDGFAAEIAEDYFHASVACPFLENENCGIYSIRPLACREYLVTSDPEFCRDPGWKDVHGVGLPLRLSRVLYSFSRQLERDPRGWIPLVFLLAWAKSGATPGDKVSGTGEEVLRIFLEKIPSVSNE